MDQWAGRLQYHDPLQTCSRNVVADTLSSLPVRDIKDLEAYSQLCCVKEVKAIFEGVVNQSCNAEAWLPKVNIIHGNMKDQGNEALYEGGQAKSPIQL